MVVSSYMMVTAIIGLTINLQNSIGFTSSRVNVYSHRSFYMSPPEVASVPNAIKQSKDTRPNKENPISEKIQKNYTNRNSNQESKGTKEKLDWKTNSTIDAPIKVVKNVPTNKQDTNAVALRTNLGDKIKALGDRREWVGAKELFEQKKGPTAIEFSAILYASRVCKEHKDGMEYYKRMVDLLGQKSVNLYVYDCVITMNLDYGDDHTARLVFADLIESEKKRRLNAQRRPTLTGASQINLQKCIFNALRASLNIQFQNTKKNIKNIPSVVDEQNDKDEIIKASDVAFFNSSLPLNSMEDTISDILEQEWVLSPMDKSLIVRAYASWNMTTQLAELTGLVFQDPLPDMLTLQTHMNSMLENYPELALLSLQWYLPTKKTNQEGEVENAATSTETILSSIISNTIMSEKRKGGVAMRINSETVPARCLGLAVKALARLDYYVGLPLKIDAILQLVRYAEETNDLTAGLVVAAIGACRLHKCFHFCVHFLCLTGRVYVFYVGHVDRVVYMKPFSTVIL
jgi:hypothetical protein